MDKKMDTLTIVVGVFTVIGVVVTIGLWMQSNIDRKIEEKINEPEFVKKIADEVKLPFLIFDEINKVIADYGAYQYLESIDVLRNEKNELTAIKIKPKRFMTSAPIIENINGNLDFYEPEREKQIDWLIKINSNTGGFRVTESHQDPVHKFKLTIFQ